MAGAGMIHRAVSMRESEFEGCWVKTYDRGIGTLPSYEGCSDGYTDFGLTCTEQLGVGGCEWYTPWYCNTYNKNPYCSASDRVYQDWLCYKKPNFGFECLLTVCETLCDAAVLGSDDCGLFCSAPGGNCIIDIFSKIFAAGKFVSSIVTINGLPAAGFVGVVKLVGTASAAKLFTGAVGGTPRSNFSLKETCNPTAGQVHSRRLTRLVPELVTDIATMHIGLLQLATGVPIRESVIDQLKVVIKTIDDVDDASATRITDGSIFLYQQMAALHHMEVNGAEGMDCFIEATAHMFSSSWSRSNPETPSFGFFKTVIKRASAMDPTGLFSLVDEFLLEVCETKPYPKHVADGFGVVCSKHSVPVNDGSNDGFGSCKCDRGWSGIDCR
jgi:hypothetical protein